MLTKDSFPLTHLFLCYQTMENTENYLYTRFSIETNRALLFHHKGGKAKCTRNGIVIRNLRCMSLQHLWSVWIERELGRLDFGPKLAYFQPILLHSPSFSPQSPSFASELSIEDAVLELRPTHIVIHKVGQFIIIIIDMIVFQMYEAS